MPATLSRSPFSDSRSVADALKRDILEGHYAPDEPLPSVREIAERFRVGMRLARNALRCLVDDGLAYTRERQGTFVSHRAAETRPASQHLERAIVIERPDGTRPHYNHVAYTESYRGLFESRGVEMALARAPSSKAQLESFFSDTIPLQRQGCILVNLPQVELIGWLNELEVPFVLQNFLAYQFSQLPPHSSVVINKVSGAFDATNYLLGLGHRRLGFMGYLPGKPEPDHFQLNVYDGFSAALKCAGVEIHARYLTGRAVNERDEGMRLARDYFERQDLPTAILAQTDNQAACLLDAAHERGLRVPEDISIVGFDGLEEFANTSPPLTTVNDPRRVLATEAAKLLLDIAADPERCPQRRILSCQLTVRQSAGPVPEHRAGEP